MSAPIAPLTRIEGDNADSFRVICRDCGDVTREESGFTVTGGTLLVRADRYRQRHLSRHLTALGIEFAEATR